MRRLITTFLSVVLCVPALVSAETSNEDTTIEIMPEIEVIGKRPKEYTREYTIVNRKRFISGPYGDADAIMKIASETRIKGDLRTVRTRQLILPHDFVSSFIDLYKYQFPSDCGGKIYSYFEGNNFKALGYHYDDIIVIFDSLESFNPFVGPTLWGPYDQIIGTVILMHPLMGDDDRDGIGYRKGSHFIGLVPILSEEEYINYGSEYNNAIQNTLPCLAKDHG